MNRRTTTDTLRLALLGLICLACTAGTFSCRSDDDEKTVVVNTR